MFVESSKQEVGQFHIHPDTERAAYDKKKDLLSNSMRVSKWVSLFDPQNINNEHLLLPNYIQAQKSFTKLIKAPYQKSAHTLQSTRIEIKKGSMETLIPFNSVRRSVGNQPRIRDHNETHRNSKGTVSR